MFVASSIVSRVLPPGIVTFFVVVLPVPKDGVSVTVQSD
jgi:hypothetical protein